MKNLPKVLIIEKANPEHEETLGADGHPCRQYWGDGFVGISRCQHLSNYIP